ncbi:MULTISPECIES: hypothetical protein [unclassified Actinomyces]|uniref:hypothetical protein n=1 Tax=unclassified Actinomyces TaxID=2609248 RepID=UPI000D5947DC|nr:MULTISPECIES: hypothetical protein [unclassified Actinomyces]RAX23607.1 hypothetical protein DRB07_04235 [Actinomyces sp. Z3]
MDVTTNPILDRLSDAELLWANGRREGAFLMVLVAVAATGRLAHPEIRGDRANFVAFMKDSHDWTISVEYRGEQVDLDHLFYKWMRCELVHNGGLPVDLQINESFAGPRRCAVRAGGAPDYTVLVSPGWYWFLAEYVRSTVER